MPIPPFNSYLLLGLTTSSSSSLVRIEFYDNTGKTNGQGVTTLTNNTPAGISSIPSGAVGAKVLKVISSASSQPDPVAVYFNNSGGGGTGPSPTTTSERLYEGQLLGDVGGQPGIIRDNPYVQIADAVNQLARATVVPYTNGGALVVSMRGKNVNEGDTAIGVYSNGSMVVAPGTRRWGGTTFTSQASHTDQSTSNLEIFGHSAVQINILLASGSPSTVKITFIASVEETGTNFFAIYATDLSDNTSAATFTKNILTTSKSFGFLVRHSGCQRLQVKIERVNTADTGLYTGNVAIISRAGNLL